MIKLPEAKETKFVYHGGNGAFDCGYESGWNAAIAEVQRLNATEQPVSGGRTMREHEFSQLVNELRDVPAIQSKREKIVGILKAFNIIPATPGGED